MATAPSRDAYDAVVIGSGVGGLTAAAFLSHAGKRVLVLEQGPDFGGYTHGFERNGYRFDPAIHSFPDAAPDGLPVALLELLGVAEIVDFRPVNEFYTANYGDLRVVVPHGIENVIEAHVQAFPREREGIERFFRLCVQLHHEAHVLPPTIGLDRLDEMAARYPVLFRHLRATTAEALDEHFDDPRLKSLASVSWPFHGTPPSTGSLVTFSTLFSVLSDGTYYPQGGFQKIVDALVTAITRNGGDLVADASVERITSADGAVTGVLLDGEHIDTPLVVSNAPTLTTLDLVGDENLPAKFVRRQRRMTLAPSAVVVFIGTSLDLAALGATHETFRPLHYDHDRTWADFEAGRPAAMWGSVSTLCDPGLAPPGHHTLTITSLARDDIGRPWAEERERYLEAVLDAWGPVFPGLRDALTMVEISTPETLKRRIANTGGAIYGWDNTPDQTGGRRSPHVMPLRGLYLAGHWTQPGSGCIRCIVSGFHAAQLALAIGGDDPIPFEHPTLPPQN